MGAPEPANDGACDGNTDANNFLRKAFSLARNDRHGGARGKEMPGSGFLAVLGMTVREE